MNAFDQNYAYDAIKNITSDGKINLNDYRAAIEYTAELNSYFRANLIKMNLQNPYLLKYYSYFLDQLLISCRYEDQNCNQSEFLQFYDFYFGLCHRFVIRPQADYKITIKIYQGTTKAMIRQEE